MLCLVHHKSCNLHKVARVVGQLDKMEIRPSQLIQAEARLYNFRGNCGKVLVLRRGLNELDRKVVKKSNL